MKRSMTDIGNWRLGTRNWNLLLVFFIIIFLSSCAPAQRACTQEAKICPDGSAVGRSGPNCEFAACPIINSILSESEAQAIAEKSCIKGGEAMSVGVHNEATKTWWFEANLNAMRLGCSPFCVVDESSKSVALIWQCADANEPAK